MAHGDCSRPAFNETCAYPLDARAAENSGVALLRTNIMPRLPIAATLLVLALHALPVQAQAPDGEPALRATLAGAVWPADIVRLADEYNQRYPGGPASANVGEWRARAVAAQRVLARSDVRLHRAAFHPDSVDEDTAADLRQAALGDREAAVRMARRAQQTTGDGAAGHRYVGWLQYASQLGDQNASYELALFFRRDAQPVLASKYEHLALNLGYEPPAALDNIRK
jgi:hypothetical protein